MFIFICNSILLGIGLAMDAFSVSLANGLAEPKMPFGKMVGVSGVYAIFQWAMPMIGWFFVHNLVRFFKVFEKFIPWIALILLAYIGGKMVYEGIKKKESQEKSKGLGLGTLMVQGIATSIDALSVGFTTAEYSLGAAMGSSVIIGLVTWVICLAGLKLGKTVGMKLADKATIVGGCILIAIGLEIFISHMIG